jgi:hypothetical protein
MGCAIFPAPLGDQKRCKKEKASQKKERQVWEFASFGGLDPLFGLSAPFFGVSASKIHISDHFWAHFSHPFRTFFRPKAKKGPKHANEESEDRGAQRDDGGDMRLRVQAVHDVALVARPQRRRNGTVLAPFSFFPDSGLFGSP